MINDIPEWYVEGIPMALNFNYDSRLEDEYEKLRETYILPSIKVIGWREASAAIRNERALIMLSNHIKSFAMVQSGARHPDDSFQYKAVADTREPHQIKLRLDVFRLLRGFNIIVIPRATVSIPFEVLMAFCEGVDPHNLTTWSDTKSTIDPKVATAYITDAIGIKKEAMTALSKRYEGIQDVFLPFLYEYHYACLRRRRFCYNHTLPGMPELTLEQTAILAGLETEASIALETLRTKLLMTDPKWESSDANKDGPLKDKIIGDLKAAIEFDPFYFGYSESYLSDERYEKIRVGYKGVIDAHRVAIQMYYYSQYFSCPDYLRLANNLQQPKENPFWTLNSQRQATSSNMNVPYLACFSLEELPPQSNTKTKYVIEDELECPEQTVAERMMTE